MRKHGFRAQAIAGLIVGGLLALLAVVLAGCPDYAHDCHLLLTCGDDGGDDAQAD
jgi:hypothetical protein